MSEFAHSEEDLSWIIPYLPINEEDKKIVELSLEPFNNSGGLSGAMKFLKVKIGDSVDQYIYKTMDNLEKSKGLGSPREALFYQVMEQKFMTDLDIGLPYVIYAHGNMATGTKVMILEDLSINGTQSGYFFGNHSPLNWGKDLAALTSVIRRKPTMEEVIRDAFATAAKIHREFWMDSSTLFQYSWLRSAGWFQGASRATWDGNQNFGLSAWKKLKATIDSKESKVNWDENLVKTADACFQKINWDDYQADIKTRKFTLIHGDFHPANIFWVNNKDDDDGKSVVIDWELVSIGSGPQDLAQYLISHVNPEERRSLEDSLLHHYYDCLTHNDSTGGKFVNASEYSYEECYQDFIHGGAEKWIWLLAMIGAFSPAPVAQYFQDQVASFLRDHGLNAENIGMPRV